MADFVSNDINDARKRVEEMRRKAQSYVSQNEDENAFFEQEKHQPNKSDNPLGFISDIASSLFSSSSKDSSSSLILALILILSREGADSKLILALLYILL